MTNLGNDLPKGSLDIRHAELEIGDIGTRIVERPTNISDVLQNKAVYLLSHDGSAAEGTLERD